MKKDATAVLPITFPGTIAIDTREQRAFAFAGIVSDAREGRRPIIVPTSRTTISSGDYSIVGYESRIAIERKSLADLFSTLGQGRKRFQRELERLNSLDFAAVVVEGDWRDVYVCPPERSSLSPKTVMRSVIAWQFRLPRIAWWFCPSREFAERVTFRLLERYLKERCKDGKHKDGKHTDGKPQDRGQGVGSSIQRTGQMDLATNGQPH